MNMRKQSFRGFALIFAVMMVIIIVAVVHIMMAHHIGSMRLLTSMDVYRQQWVEAGYLSHVLKETILTQRSVSGEPACLENVGETFVRKLGPVAANARVSYGFGSGQVPGNMGNSAAFVAAFSAGWVWPAGLAGGIGDVMFPSAGRPFCVSDHLTGGVGAREALEGCGGGVLQMLSTGPFVEFTRPGTGAWPWSHPGNLAGDSDSGPWHPVPRFGRYVAGGNSGDVVGFSGRFRIFGIPITNFQRVVYGLPGSATVPDAVEPLPAGNYSGHHLAVTRNDPELDATGFRDLCLVSGTAAVLPYRYREVVSGAWDLFEFLFGSPSTGIFSSQYLSGLKMSAVMGGRFFDFLAPGGLLVGFSYDDVSKTLEVDLGLLGAGAGSDPVVFAINSDGGLGTPCKIVLKGCGDASRPPVVLLVDTQNPGFFSEITFQGNNLRPVLLYLVGCQVNMDVEFAGGVFLSPTSYIRGAGVVYGTLAEYHAPIVPTGAFPVPKVFLDENVRAALADVAPRFLVVSAKFLRD